MNLEEKRAFAKALSVDSMVEACRDDEVFSDAVALATEDYGVRKADLAKALGVTHSTVSRWANGQAAPQVFYRPQVIAALVTLLNETIP